VPDGALAAIQVEVAEALGLELEPRVVLGVDELDLARDRSDRCGSRGFSSAGSSVWM